ncbi:MAG: ABC transporter ATP-binding protein [Dysgonomonas sp.]|nr:ABC transporter ATP-binding protein [Dysgonomonas sp.]
MSDIAIKFENISKQYRLGLVGTGTISHDLNRWWHTVRGKEDPYLKVGEINDRASKATSKYVWALKDITFDVKQGEVLGIIGKNGAGKSTLLKILSRVTSPTTGFIKAKGRIASLLEVGTGFHPELTGRENIYMNGAIMGMTKPEINRKLDEIVAFAGVEKYIDTPVKRYSSGMTVRLGFAIAAHLEPEILVVDEVLAVGDAEFQKKAIGKMQDVSKGEGRTVLFVSHNMDSIKSLCTSGVLLENGGVSYMGDINECIEKYQIDNNTNKDKIIDNIKYHNPDISLNSITINNSPYSHISLSSNENIVNIRIDGHLNTNKKMALEAIFLDSLNREIFFYSPSHYTGNVPFFDAGNFVIDQNIILPNGLNQMNLYIDFYLTYPGYEGYLETASRVKLSIEGTKIANGQILSSSSGLIFLH